MPFVAAHGERRVIPEEVDDDADLSCPSCGDSMGVRGPFSDGRARHFFHHSEARFGQCNPIGGESAGESDIHRKLKSQAVSALREHYGDEACRCAPEIALDVSETETDTDERRADALVEFHEPNRFYGQGIIVEVQYKNLGKDERGTTHDYLKLGYSVYWATPEDFSEDRFDVKGMEQAFNDGDLAAFSVYHDDPPSLKMPEEVSVLEEIEGTLIPIERLAEDPVPQCSHQFEIRGPSLRDNESRERYCLSCGLHFVRCYYSEELGRFRRVGRSPRTGDDVYLCYDSEPSPFSPLIKEVVEKGDPPDNHSHLWKNRQSGYSERWYECYYCQSTMLVQRDVLRVTHRPPAEDKDSRWTPDEAL